MRGLKEKAFLVADTESLGLGDKAIVFDFAYKIITRKADKIERSFLVRETITNPKLMLSAYCDKNWRAMFGGKLFHHYIPELHHHRIGLYPWEEIIETLRDDMLTYNVQVFSAYNLRFDMGALSKTSSRHGGPDKILTYRPDLLCLWQFACETVFQSKLYDDIARANDWVSPAGNVRTNAEKAYAFLTGNFDFIESHTALADTEIEAEILRRLLARKKKIPYNVLSRAPWKLAQQQRG
jgi:hypothetical protein